MPEQTLNAGELLTLFSTIGHPHAEAHVEDTWRPLLQCCTDLNDEEQPVFLDLGAPYERRLLTINDEVTVRGLTDQP